MEAPEASTKEDLGRAIQRFVELHSSLKEHNAQGRIIRQGMSELKTVIITMMEQLQLDVCNVKKGDQEGELALRTAKRTKSLKKEEALGEIVKYFSEHCGDDASTRAEQLWQGMQNTRESTEVRDLSVRKFK
jgi:2-keto-4-pentenoate hydratase/2-oxohepta-3-ene-1,7-dioic acid hydratase in catechol pathway